MMVKTAARQKDQTVIGLFRQIPRARPLYRGIVGVLERALASGVVAAGQRLPPERDLARALSVSRTTVVSAYRELESKGLVRGFVGRGTFVAARPDPGSAPFAWRGKVAAAALQYDDSTVKELMRVSADARLTSFAAGEPALDRF